MVKVISDITAIIIAGGNSFRIGEDKAMLTLNGITIIERTFNLLQNIFSKTIIISNNTHNYKFLTKKIYKDIFPGLGPLSGIHSGLKHSQTNINFIISCDLPLINSQTINFIISKNSASDIILPKTESIIHSLCGIYKKSCLETAEKLLQNANTKINERNSKTKVKLFDLINSVRTDYIELSREKFYEEDVMFNMNTLNDYEYLKARMNNQ